MSNITTVELTAGIKQLSATRCAFSGVELWPHGQVLQKELSPGSCPSS